MAAPQLILVNRMKVQGFIVSEHMEHLAAGAEGTGHAGVATGKLKYRETVAQGIESRAARPSSACSRAGTSASSWSS